MRILLPFFLVCLTSCTICFQNIHTHGTSSDLVDDNLSTTPTVKATANVPVSPLSPSRPLI